MRRHITPAQRYTPCYRLCLNSPFLRINPVKTLHSFDFILAFLAVALGITAPSAHALMAGASPDSPVARIDANTASSPFAGVASISIGGNTFSGVLVAPGYLLTAAHVTAQAGVISDITVNFNAGGDLPYQVGASAIYVNPNYVAPVSGRVGESDLAIIKLADAAPASVPSYGLYRNPLVTGTTLTLVGYGASGSASAGVADVAADAAIKRTGKNNADYIAPSLDGRLSQAIYYFDFDGPTLASNLIGAPTPANGTLGNGIETTLASGDSGSPAFVQDGAGNWLLAGINTFRLGSGYGFGNGVGGGGVVVAGYASWIDSVTSPVPEPMPSQSLLVGLGLMAGAGLWRRTR